MDSHKNLKPTKSINCRGVLLPLDTPKIMGILNVTPDSFHDGGRFTHVDNALLQARKMLEQGATIIDVGGYSTRPGADDIPVDEELDRTLPVIERLVKEFPGIIISIDTFRATVAEACIQAGAAIINDISAGDDDPDMIPLVARLNVPYIIMHKQGTPQTMQVNPQYTHVVQEVLQYMAHKVALLRSLHVHDIIADPGFGFGKTTGHNYQLLKQLEAFKILDVPLLAGVSRKRMVNQVLGIKAAEALNGTTVVNTLALLNGANILRVHDVREAMEAVKIVGYYKSA